MKTNTINKTKALFLTILMLISILIISIKVNAADGTASLSADQVSPNQTVTLTLTISGADFGSAGISISGVENATLASGPNSNVYQEGSSFNITTDLANNSSTSHTYVVNFSYSAEGTKSINISYDLISADLNRTVLNRAFTVKVVAPTPTPTPVPTPTPKPTPTPTPKPTTKNTTKSTTQAKPTTKTTSSNSKDDNNKNYESINKKMLVSSDLDIRSEASLSSSYLGSFDKGTVVDVIGVTDSGWYVINYNGKTAYLAGSYLEEYNASNTTKSNEEESDSKNTTASSDNDSESETSKTNKDDKSRKTKKTSKNNTKETTTEKNDSALINNNDSDSKSGNNKSFFANLDPTMLIIFGLSVLLIILLIVYYILKRRILADEEQEEEEFEELPGDNDEAVYANKSSDIEVSRVDDSESPKK